LVELVAAHLGEAFAAADDEREELERTPDVRAAARSLRAWNA